jgi:hypothetical protein
VPLLLICLFILLCIHPLVPAAAACVRYPVHDAGHYYLIHLFILYYLVPAAAACVRHSAGHAIIIYYLFIFSCSGSMREASCGSVMPAITILLLLSLYNSVLLHTATRSAAHCHAATHALLHCHTLLSTPPYTAARTARTLPCALPHTATHTLPHTNG